MESLFYCKRFTTLNVSIQISNFVLNMAYDYAYCFRQDLNKLLQLRSDTIWNGTPCLRNYCFLLSNDFLTASSSRAWRGFRGMFMSTLPFNVQDEEDGFLHETSHVLFKKAHTKIMSRNKRTMKIIPWILWCLLIRLILSCEQNF